jgi:ribonuclease P protein component
MFPKNHRVPRERIKQVLFEGCKIQTELFLLRKLKNNNSSNRFAIVVSKKVARLAVKRQCIKRRLRNSISESFADKQNNNFDIIFIVNKKINQSDSQKIKEEITKIISLIG